MFRTNCFILSLLFCFSFVSATLANDLDLTILYDNNPHDEKLETRWGFSCLVEGPEKTIIFDVGGEGAVLLGNLRRLKINPKRVNLVVLSHIHQDHVGGLGAFLRENSDVIVFMPGSFPERIKEDVRRARARLVEVREPMRICKGVYSTGELGGCLKEQSLITETSKGLVVISGCAHPGIVNIIKKAKKMLGSDVYLALGGFHLSWMSSRRIEVIINQFKEEKVKKIAPCHCSGDSARKLFEKAYAEDFIPAGVGKKIKIEDAL